MIDKKEQGKKSRAAGKAFELRVRSYLEQTGWTVDRWTNQVEFEEVPKEIKGRYSTQDIIEGKNYPQGTIRDKYGTPLKKGKLVPAKPKFIFNPVIKRRIPIGLQSGFPDFIAFKEMITEAQNDHHEIILGYEIIGVESKMDGKLDKEEKEKCRWLLQNVFQKIIIAQKGIKRGEILYKEWKL